MSDDVRHRYKDWQTALAATVYPEGFTGIALEPTAWDAVRLIDRLRAELAEALDARNHYKKEVERVWKFAGLADRLRTELAQIRKDWQKDVFELRCRIKERDQRIADCDRLEEALNGAVKKLERATSARDAAVARADRFRETLVTVTNVGSGEARRLAMIALQKDQT